MRIPSQGRQGDKETRRQGEMWEMTMIANSYALRVSLSPCLLVSLSALTVGCGGGQSLPTRGGPDGREIAKLFGILNDNVSNMKGMTARFTNRAMPNK